MDAHQPFISVIIPTSNRAHLLPRAIESVFNQTYTHLEIIIVDDASTDDTPNVVMALEDNRIRYFCHTTKCGGSAARNTGIKAAQGDYVAFLDDDDEWLPEKLSKQLHAIKAVSFTEPVVAYTGNEYVNPEGKVIRKLLAKKEGWILQDLLYGNYVGSTSKILVSRASLLAVNGFDTTLRSCQDWDLWIRLAGRYPYVAVCEPLVKLHVEHGERIDSNLAAQIEGRLCLLAKIQPQLAQLTWWHRHAVYANHYLQIASHYNVHNKKIHALKWAISSCILNPLNWRAWYQLARFISS